MRLYNAYICPILYTLLPCSLLRTSKFRAVCSGPATVDVKAGDFHGGLNQHCRRACLADQIQGPQSRSQDTIVFTLGTPLENNP